jgi:nitrite reductase/ring-hydroxylating ferredoxin subunit
MSVTALRRDWGASRPVGFAGHSPIYEGGVTDRATLGSPGLRDELGSRIVARTILDQAIVLNVAALEGRCPHRLVPLSLGIVVGNNLRCGYHGAEFAADGACVRVPEQKIVARSTRIRSCPVLERHGYYWIWMGDPDLCASINEVADFIFGEDKPVLEAQQRLVGDKDLFDHKPLSFSGDRLPIEARKILKRLIDEPAADTEKTDQRAPRGDPRDAQHDALFLGLSTGLQAGRSSPGLPGVVRSAVMEDIESLVAVEAMLREEGEDLLEISLQGGRRLVQGPGARSEADGAGSVFRLPNASSA